MQELLIDEKALLRLYAPWEEPDKHRDGEEVVEGRRHSQLPIVNTLRGQVKKWRESGYEGASDTSRELLIHWFGGVHLLSNNEFRYYFCQREAIETLVYLYEIQWHRNVSELITEYDSSLSKLEKITAVATVPPTENLWAKYAFKLATGTGKTKCMSLAIVWSYFHALREPDSKMTTRFLIIAPGLTVYERLSDDFSNGKIFRTDPLIPNAWQKDWHVNVIEQNEPGGAGEGVIYLTNIQKLYPKRQRNADEYYDFMGPPVPTTRSIDIGAELRARISKESRLMILNDEAHHVWHPDLAWNQALKFFHDECDSIVAQLDFSATPRDQGGNPFRHIICDTPLGEAVYAGIVKVPIIGEAEMREAPSENAAEKYREYLEVGYRRWRESFEEWKISDKKVLMFVMCEDTQAADEIAEALNTDPYFEQLNGKTLNLHTNLKGSVNRHGEFVESETQMNDADLKVLRQLSRTLDSNENPYSCIVSVLMLREGWDVRNVTTIVPLRPYTSEAQILPEQTLGRGLRRMTYPSETEVVETVVVIEHPAFRQLYEEALGAEGITPITRGAGSIGVTVIHIYPDPEKEEGLDIEYPQITYAHSLNLTELENITQQDLEEQFENFEKLPLESATSIDYQGRHMLTQEIVEKMTLESPLLANGWTAITYFVKQLEYTCRVPPTTLHAVISPLLKYFLTEMLFEESVTLTDPRLINRLSDQDVRNTINMVFAQLILDRIIRTADRKEMTSKPIWLSEWHPYEFTASKQNPAIEANKTLFNLVPCHRHFEKEFAEWLDRTTNVDAFAKNAGPEALRIDYLDVEGRISRYIPDFFVRDTEGNYYLVETKGFPDSNVAQKAKAAVSWCKTASEAAEASWQYLFVHQSECDFNYIHSLEQLISIASHIPEE